jgi:probable F420-dependent oxidoreductase
LAARPTFGLKLPNCGGMMCPPEWATPETILRLATRAAELDLHSVWLHDHFLVPTEFAHLPHAPGFDPLTVMGYLAASTQTIKIGTAALVLPLHEPVLLAKRMMTLESFAPGRTIFGVGAGQYESEFDAFGSDIFSKRGRVTEEYLNIVRALVSDGPVSFDGEFRRLRDARFEPRSGAIGRPPVWVAGKAPVAIRRAARLGQGWICVNMPPEDVRHGADLIAETRAADTASADGEFTIAMSTTISRQSAGTARQDRKLHEHKTSFSGDATGVAETIGRYVAAGVDHFIVTFATETVEALLEDLEWFVREVVPVTADQARTVA